ncbi:hypothetical protein ACFYVL_04560 [Streptomyces sp. NPDC004111]|uniref:hypothetical protein n=1 Tax=Streptomyces sp. NPDC004111 TaxID=3364690 RepID=UPI0036A6CFDD
MRTSRIATVLGTATAATLLAIGPSSAFTLEYDHAGTTPWPSSSGARCGSSSAVHSCFRSNGDWFSITDLKSDGHSAVVRWRSYDPKTNVLNRGGIIWNTGGLNAVRYQNKNLPEGDFVEWEMCTGEFSTKHVIENSCVTMSAHA